MCGPGRTVLTKSWLMNEGEGMGGEDKAKSSIMMENGTYLEHKAKSRGEHPELSERIYQRKHMGLAIAQHHLILELKF